jgi:hypothetical protein
MKLFDQAQKRFLDEVKRKIPGNVSLAEVIADDLNISNDSAYRRIRGDTHLTLAECVVLCSKYNVSLDSLFENSASHIMFNLLSNLISGRFLITWKPLSNLKKKK